MYEVDEPMNGKKFEMLFNNIMVKRFKESNVTASGIIKSSKAEIIRRQEGIVLEVGPGEVMDDGTIRPMKIKPGDVVWFGEYAGVEFKICDEQILFMKDVDIVAIVTDMPEQEIN
jgi:chaperonin GroES